MTPLSSFCFHAFSRSCEPLKDSYYASSKSIMSQEEEEEGWRERLGIDFAIDLSDSSDIDEEGPLKNSSSRRGDRRRDSSEGASRRSKYEFFYKISLNFLSLNKY